MCIISWVRIMVGSIQKNIKYKMLVAASPTQHATLWSKSKDWLTRNQDKMFQCRGMSIR